MAGFGRIPLPPPPPVRSSAQLGIARSRKRKKSPWQCSFPLFLPLSCIKLCTLPSVGYVYACASIHTRARAPTPCTGDPRPTAHSPALPVTRSMRTDSGRDRDTPKKKREEGGSRKGVKGETIPFFLPPSACCPTYATHRGCTWRTRYCLRARPLQ